MPSQSTTYCSRTSVAPPHFFYSLCPKRILLSPHAHIAVNPSLPLQISLGGYAQIPEVCLLETAFDFGSLTAGGCESLPATLVNKGLMPASLHLNLTQFPEFHLEPKKTLPAAAGRTLRGGEAGEDNHGRDER